MTGTMRVDTAGLRAAEPALRYLSTSVGTMLTRLAGVLDAAGCCWGNDQIGASFAESYVPGARLVRDALPSLRDASIWPPARSHRPRRQYVDSC